MPYRCEQGNLLLPTGPANLLSWKQCSCWMFFSCKYNHKDALVGCGTYRNLQENNMPL